MRGSSGVWAQRAGRFPESAELIVSNGGPHHPAQGQIRRFTNEARQIGQSTVHPTAVSSVEMARIVPTFSVARHFLAGDYQTPSRRVNRSGVQLSRTSISRPPGRFLTK
jgi:hypothetical protein